MVQAQTSVIKLARSVWSMGIDSTVKNALGLQAKGPFLHELFLRLEN